MYIARQSVAGKENRSGPSAREKLVGPVRRKAVDVHASRYVRFAGRRDPESSDGSDGSDLDDFIKGNDEEASVSGSSESGCSGSTCEGHGEADSAEEGESSDASPSVAGESADGESLDDGAVDALTDEVEDLLLASASRTDREPFALASAPRRRLYQHR